MDDNISITTNVIYENHLKSAYAVKNKPRHLAITDTSCYQLSEETAWLISILPARGEAKLYFNYLSGLGLDKPQKIFERLVAIGVLREKRKRSLKDVVGSFLMPKMQLFSAQWQEKIIHYLLPETYYTNKSMQIPVVAAALGLLWGAALFVVGPDKAMPAPLTGKINGPMVFLLVIAGSLVHEMGHSFASMVSGIGLRPIGLSVYLIYPVFYTNVSGIENISLGKKALVDCGGFIFQGIFLFFLLLVCSFTGSFTFIESARWIVVIILFNLNPLFRTDGYWLYKDVYSEFKMKRWAHLTHYLYLAAFIAFSIYFLWCVCSRLGYVWNSLGMLVHSPSYFFSGGYRVVLGVYFIMIGITGGLHRFQEGHREWKELRKIKHTGSNGTKNSLKGVASENGKNRTLRNYP